MEKPTKTSSGKWRIRVLLGCDPDGRRAYKSIQADTRAECLEKARAYSYAIEQGIIKPPIRPKIADLTRVCDAVDKYISAAEKLHKFGDVIKTDAGLTVSPYLAVQKKAEDTIFKCSSRLGLATTDRLRLIVPKVEEKSENKYLKFIKG